MFFSCMKNVELSEDRSLNKDYLTKQIYLVKTGSDFFRKIENCDPITKEHLKYIFAYMPLSDFADYDFEFFLHQVEYSKLASETFPWASNIPDDVYKHYVLPPRVNNENLDTARMVIFCELKDRLLPMNLDAEQAALEINHWCHEKVIYKGTDERTISPLAIMRSGFGRCGEESTFLVTALRAAGIPARQVYTPRWAHTDDNHAWVEVWIKGEWKYLGACEPLPALNMGWFTVPATRTMLVHTKQFGENDSKNRYYLDRTENYTWINTLSTYAPVKNICVVVVDENNIPVWQAAVRFQLYNYAEMYPIHKTRTSFAGMAKFKTGYGSLEVLVNYNGKTASKTIDPNDAGIIRIVLGKDDAFSAQEVTYVPPIAGKIPEIDSKAETINAARLDQEDKIRKENESFYYDEFKAQEFVKAFEYQKETMAYLIGSRGNWLEIESFLIECSYRNMRAQAYELLSILPEKDLRDIKSEFLSEHLELAIKCKNISQPDSIFRDFVLNPRIAFEMITNYRSLILNSTDSLIITDLRLNPDKIDDYVLNIIKTEAGPIGFKIKTDEINKYNVPITPSGVHKLKLADSQSLLIYYVAFCRTLGVPARINQAVGVAQYYVNGKWNDALLNPRAERTITKRGKILLTSADNSRDLKYRIHFSLARFEDGFYNTVDLGWEIPMSEFAGGLDLPIGDYMLLTALRNPDGSVLVNRKYFKLLADKSVNLIIKLPVSDIFTAETKAFNHGNLKNKYGNFINSSSLCHNGRATAFCWLNPSQEPSKHIVRDISPMINELNSNGIDIVYLVHSSDFDPLNYEFPTNFMFLQDADYKLLNINKACKSTEKQEVFPQIIMVNSKEQSFFSSTGYVIAVGELMINEWKKH